MNPKHLLGCVGGVVVAAAFLALVGLPVGKYLPYLVLLACPLMMVVMMRMMGGHGNHCEHDHEKAEPEIGEGEKDERLDLKK